MLSTLILALSACASAEVRHTVVNTNHLWGLAERYYSDPFKWPKIHAANPWLKDPHWIYPGQVVIIPDVDVPRPETEEPAPAQEAQSEPAVASARPPEPEPEPEPVIPPPSVDSDSLSTEIPESLSGQYPSMSRFQAPAGWKRDGVITLFEGREIMAAQGDIVSGRVEAALKPGDRLYVLRKDAPEDADEDKKALYLMRVGVVRVEEALGKDRYRLLILKSGDAVQLGDFLSRRPL